MLTVIRKMILPSLSLGFTLLTGCATESSVVLESRTVESYRTAYQGEKVSLIVGAFENRSGYLQSVFSSGDDRFGNQAKTILKTHLHQSGRFQLMDRANMKAIERETTLLGETQQLKGARYAVSGAVTEFGRKTTGDQQLFGILGAGKKQTAYAKVSINIVDVVTSEIVYSTQGAGEVALSHREVVGFGGAAGYDSTLNGKVLNLAVTEAVNNLTRDLSNQAWVTR